MRAQALEEKRAKAAARAFNHFRPRKSEWGKYVFVGMDGKRLEQGSQRKGFVIYTNTKGKKQLIQEERDRAKHGTRTPAPQRRST